jgi:hypothetical protein
LTLHGTNSQQCHCFCSVWYSGFSAHCHHYDAVGHKCPSIAFETAITSRDQKHDEIYTSISRSSRDYHIKTFIPGRVQLRGNKCLYVVTLCLWATVVMTAQSGYTFAAAQHLMHIQKRRVNICFCQKKTGKRTPICIRAESMINMHAFYKTIECIAHAIQVSKL